MKLKPITKLNRLIHGGDYNPDQWLEYPDILKQDIEYMKKTQINAVSLGIFAWSALEPEEGVFNFNWMEDVINSLYENEIYTILATPSGARPAWLALKYPEVLRTTENRQKNLFGHRHNHCLTSPIYREKVKIMNQELAKRFAKHPGVILWHISNEYNGECHCELCQHAFRGWLKEKYGDINTLNQQWWNSFWSHTYNSFDQIESPSSIGENTVHGLNLDWKKFVSQQTIQFYLHEVNSIKTIDNSLPFTTNFMGTFDGLDYMKFAKELDVVSLDSYPEWNHGNDYERAASVAFVYDLYRSLKNGNPFLLMESTPSITNWQKVSKLKRPGMHLLTSLQAIAHGSDSVQYFQFRKSRGSFEKFHGAVVDHDGKDTHRVFKEVKVVGESLMVLNDLIGTTVHSNVAILYDWPNKWAINEAKGPRNVGMKYDECVQGFHRSFWKQGIPVDVIGIDHDFSKYKVIVVPMLYSMSESTSQKILNYVQEGGCLVVSYFTGYVNEDDLVYLNGLPEKNLRKVIGLKVDEIDALYDGESNEIEIVDLDSPLYGKGYTCTELCELVTLEGAKVLGKYKHDFYQGYAALTVNHYGKGKAYYIASRLCQNFNDDFLSNLCKEKNISSVINYDIPYGLSIASRQNDKDEYIFIMNFSQDDKTVELNGNKFYDLHDQLIFKNSITLGKYGVEIIKRKVEVLE